MHAELYVCSSYVATACLQEYPGEELLLVYDHEYKYGENFYICLTEEAKELVLNVCRTLLTMHLRTYVHVSPTCAAVCSEDRAFYVTQQPFCKPIQQLHSMPTEFCRLCVCLCVANIFNSE